MRDNPPKQRKVAVTKATLKMLTDFYLSDMRLKNRTPDSVRTNESTLRRLAASLAVGGEIAWGMVTPERVRGYIESLQARGSKYAGHPNRPEVREALSPYTIRKTVKILRGFGTWTEREGYGNPFADLAIPSVPKSVIETLTPEEVGKIAAKLNPNTAQGSRNYAMVLLMLDSGLRIGEVITARLADLDLKERRVKVLGKGRKEREVPFGQKTARALLRYIETARPAPVNPGDSFVFLAVDGCALTRNAMEGIIRRMRKSSGVDKLHGHLFRHTFAVNYLAAGGDVETLRRILGHESLEVTKRYLSGLTAAHVRAMYDEYSPVDRLDVGQASRRFGRGKPAGRPDKSDPPRAHASSGGA
jgi:site-specific recombinase XerD